MRKKILFSLILLSLYLVMAGGPGTSSQAVLSAPGTPALRFVGEFSLDKVTSDMGFGRMPLYFIPNKGQLDNRVFYYVQGQDKTLYFGAEGLTYVLKEPKGPAELIRSWVLKLDFVGANPGILPEGLEETGAVISYFKGPKEEWKTGLPTYFKVAYRELWPGIDLVFSGRPQELKYEFAVKPGADPSLIRLCYRGAESVRVNDSGELEIKSPVASFKDGKPIAWQDMDGRRREVSVAYHLKASSPEGGPQGSVAYGFQVGSYDRARPLILDPATLIYCGYIGGSSMDYGYGVAVDGSGNAYITGETGSNEITFPETVGPDLTHNGGFDDAFVAKVKSDGTGLIYCGYIGGSDYDYGYGIAVDGSGNAYVTGKTFSRETSFPVTRGPDLTYNEGICDAFVAKVKSDGTGLDYCGYIGGSDYDYGYGIAVDGSGNAYITGNTDSSQTTFPEIVGPDLTYNSGYDAFVAKVRSDGTGLIYCGYIGGSGTDYGYGIAVDGSGNAYVTGDTSSNETTFPVTVGPDLTYYSGYDAFVAKVKSDGTGLNYCGYIGGSGRDCSYAIAVDGSENAYVAGYTVSRIFPEIVGPDLTFNGYADAFVAKVKSDGTGLDYCGYIGGSGNDYGYGIAVDGSGNAYVTGSTESSQTTFPVTRGPDLTHNGGRDAFVAKVRSYGTGLNYCGYIGGSSGDDGEAIAVDGSGNVYVSGSADSTEGTFPVTVGPDLTHNGHRDLFIAKISPLVADISLSKSVDNINAVLGDTVNFTVTATDLGPDDATGVKVKDLLPSGLGLVSATASQGTFTEATGLWTVGGLTNGSSASLTLRAKVNIQGALTNTATVIEVYETDPNAENDTASVTIWSQYKVYPPSNFQLERLENDLIFFKEYVNRLSWVPNPLNLAAIVNCRLYRKAKDQPNTAFALCIELAASATSFDDRGLKNDELFTYRITSVSEAGIESQPVEAGN